MRRCGAEELAQRSQGDVHWCVKENKRDGRARNRRCSPEFGETGGKNGGGGGSNSSSPTAIGLGFSGEKEAVVLGLIWGRTEETTRDESAGFLEGIECGNLERDLGRG